MEDMEEKEAYKARVVDAWLDEKTKAIEIAFIYYNSLTGNINYDSISPSSSRYEKARRIDVGDEVFAQPTAYNKIVAFIFNTTAKRWYVDTIVATKEALRRAFTK